MNRYRKILKEVLAQEDQDRERKIEYLMPRLCGLVDDAPYIFALDNGVAARAGQRRSCIDGTVHPVYQSQYQYR